MSEEGMYADNSRLSGRARTLALRMVQPLYLNYCVYGRTAWRTSRIICVDRVHRGYVGRYTRAGNANLHGAASLWLCSACVARTRAT
eukprot:6175069-Pleurochrysis_carterae.AAC.3